MQHHDLAERFGIRVPDGSDATRWDAFIAAQQARTYAGLVPDGFEQRMLAHTAADPAARAAAFEQPGTTVRLIAEQDGELVGAIEVSDAPAAWEVTLGLGDAPASRELSRLYLAEHTHGTGLASHLLSAALGDGDAYLWLIDGNARAQRFYRRHGFADHGPSVPAGASWGGIPMHRMARLR